MLQGPARLTALAYHRIDQLPGASYEWDPGMVSASPEEFEWQLDYVRRRFSVISIDDLAAFVTGRGSLPPRPALITFDDGYRDNYTNALPALRERGLPAVIFLLTGAMGQSAPQWWDLCSHAFAHAPSARLELPLIGERNLIDPEERNATQHEFKGRLKQLHPDERDRYLADLLDVLGVAPGVDGPAFMSWDEARECAAAGVSCQGHTVSHPILSRVPLDAAESEITESMRVVSAEVGQPTLAFAYPNGLEEDITPGVVAATRDSGAKVAFMLDGGPAGLTQVGREPYTIARVPIQANDVRGAFAARVMGAQTAYDRTVASVRRVRDRLPCSSR